LVFRRDGNCDVEVHDAAALLLEHEEHVQDAKRGCGNDKEVERWGIRRSSPDFWPVLNSVTAYVKRTNPSGAPQRAGGRAATFDINRYKNL
jgi:hypothetical protein